MFRVLDLFSGIGGFSIGLERAGFQTVAFCEIDPYCRQVLAQHWPKVPCYGDVKNLNADALCRDGIAVDVICGGFPCQDVSLVGDVWGDGDGLDGERSGLWTEYARLVGELGPSVVIVENVSALIGRGLERVLGDLAALGYDAEWHCVPASAVGAPHGRDRIWIVAYAGSLRSQGIRLPVIGEQEIRDQFARSKAPRGTEPAMPDRGSWADEPAVGRVADGVPNRVERITALGNAVVPDLPEMIGRAVMRAIP